MGVNQDGDSTKNKRRQHVIGVEWMLAQQVEHFVRDKPGNNDSNEPPVPACAAPGHREDHEDGGYRAEGVTNRIRDDPIVYVIRIDVRPVETSGHLRQEECGNPDAQRPLLQRRVVVSRNQVVANAPGDEGNQEKRDESIQDATTLRPASLLPLSIQKTCQPASRRYAIGRAAASRLVFVGAELATILFSGIGDRSFLRSGGRSLLRRIEPLSRLLDRTSDVGLDLDVVHERGPHSGQTERQVLTSCNGDTK